MSVSSETNGLMNHSELIQVSGSFCLQCTLRFLLLCYYNNLPCTPISLPNTDLSKLQHLPRDPWTPPCQRARQEVLEEVLFCLAEVRALFLQQGNFQGQSMRIKVIQNLFGEITPQTFSLTLFFRKLELFLAIFACHLDLEHVEKPLNTTLHEVILSVRYKYVCRSFRMCFPMTIYPETSVFFM